nr:hypothetical protein [Phocid alphaherpesvirus 1]
MSFTSASYCLAESPISGTNTGMGSSDAAYLAAACLISGSSHRPSLESPVPPYRTLPFGGGSDPGHGSPDGVHIGPCAGTMPIDIPSLGNEIFDLDPGFGPLFFLGAADDSLLVGGFWVSVVETDF